MIKQLEQGVFDRFSGLEGQFPSRIRPHWTLTEFNAKLWQNNLPIRCTMKKIILLFLAITAVQSHAETDVLFIGNSFTYGWGSAVRHYRPDTVTDLNAEGVGGVPALFKSFADQAGLDYGVYLETRGGAGIDFHLENKLGVIGRRPWDQVVMHGYSTLDADEPGNPDKLVETVADMTEFLRSKNAAVEVYLTSTWSRADQTYLPDRPWTGQPIHQMALDVRAGYDLAARAPGVVAVNGVGEAWNRAMDSGIADPNPYDGIDLDKVDLWTYDHYHASNYGYYLEALVVFGNLTGLDPRSLGENECSGYELGMSRNQVRMLQQAAFDQLASEGRVEANPLELPRPVAAQRCSN